MHPFRAWWLTVFTALGASADGFAADPPPTTVYAKLFGPPKPKVGPVARTVPSRPPVSATLPPDIVATALRAEQEAWERRMSVCLKVRQVAMEANDESLLRQVDDIERQATALYTARTTALGIPKVNPAPLDTPSDVRAAAKKLAAPSSPTAVEPEVRTAEARTPDDVIREVRP